MAERDNVIQILFGVAGGSSISGESGAQIKKDLESIASQIKVAVAIDDTGFKSQVQELKKYIQEEIGKVAVKVAVGETKVTQRTSGSNTESQTKSVEKQSSAYEQLRKEIIAAANAEKARAKEVDTGTQKYKALQTQVKNTGTLSRKYGPKALNENKDITEDERNSLLLLRQELQKTIKERQKLTAATQNDKLARGSATSYNGLIANVQSLNERYSSLIKTNRDAAKVMEDLNKLASQPLSGNYSEASQQISTLAQQSRKASGELAKISAETDTIGKRLRETFSSKIIQTFSYAIIGFGANAISQVYKNVVQLDSAITDLQIATGETREETAKLVKSYGDLAQQLGSTISEVASGADTWLRQGYSIAETNQLIADSMMLAKLGQLDAAEAAKALTSAMKGYGVSVNDAMGIVDKFTAVDMEAAVSAGGIATAMAETAAGAQLAGISMDRLIGQIALVAEVTQDGEESVGTFFRTLYARMGNIKVGKFVDDETGESLNDVEKVLGKLGIQLRDEQGLFRNFADVLDETAANWDNYTNVQQHAIATAFAGTRQQEKFIILMRDYGKALDYAAVAADSAGTAQEKFNAAYMDSIEAKINGLTAAWEKFSMTILDSDFVKGFVTVLTGLANALTAISGWADGALVWIPAITAAVLVLITAIQRAAKSQIIIDLWKNVKGMVSVFPAIVKGIKAVVLTIGEWTTANKSLAAATNMATKAEQARQAASSAFKATNVLGWISLAVTAITAIVSAIKKANQAAEEAAKKAKELADQARENTEAAKEETDQLKDLIDQYEELAKSNNNGLDYNAETRNKILEIQTEIVKLVGEEASGLDLLNDKYDEQIDKLSSISKYSYQEQRGKAISALIAAEEAAKNMTLQDQGDSGTQSTFQNKSDLFTGVLGTYISKSEAQDIAFDLANELAEATGLEFGTSPGETGIHIQIANNERTNTYIPQIGINVDKSDPNKALSQLDAIRDFLIEEGLVREYEDMFTAVETMRENVLEYVNNITAAQDSLLDSTIGSLGVEGVRDIGSIGEYKSFRDSLINNVLNDSEIDRLVTAGDMTREDVTEAVDDWLALYASKWFDAFNEEQSSAIITSKSFLDILNEIEGEFNALSNAAKSIDENGILGADAIREILEEYEDLERYFEKTDDGYIFGIKNEETGERWNSTDVINAYMQEYLQTYQDEIDKCKEGTDEWKTAVDNYNNALAVSSTLLRELFGEAVDPSKTYLDILNEIEGKFNALAEAAENFHEEGIISAEAIRKVLEDYEGLEKYFEQTDQGYILGENPDTGLPWETQDVLEAYVKDYLQGYLDAVNKCEEGTDEWTVAANNYNNALSACTTLLRKFMEAAVNPSKTYLDILNEIESEFDALNNALTSFDENGIVSADAIRKVLEEYKDLERFFNLTENGYVLGNNPETGEGWTHNDALETYVKEYLQRYLETVNKCEEGTDAWTIAVNNYNNALAVCATLLQTAQIQSTETWEAEIDNLEESREALEDQLSRYREIIDLRKDLLNSYKEELDYQKELNSKQKNVVDLRTQLSVARLDTSAAGQARVRELEQELEEAQSDLDDFTLEHAIDVLSKELDDQYSEYEKFINSEVTKISDKITSLEQTIEESTEKISIKLEGFDWIDVGDSNLPAAEEDTDVTIEGFESIDVPENEPPVEDTPEEKPPTEEETRPNDTDPPKKPSTSNLPKPGASIIIDNRGQNPIAGGGGINRWSHLISQSHIYHSGGFVGGKAGLKSNEEFAKLMKTEFVSTPKQISNFMNKTLPAIAGSGNAVQINAPLISLQCDTMSEETYPKVKSLVEQAVNKVKDQIDSVFSRTGYKNPTKFNI